MYSPESRVRKTGSYIYEDFMPTDGTDVKVNLTILCSAVYKFACYYGNKYFLDFLLFYSGTYLLTLFTCIPRLF